MANETIMNSENRKPTTISEITEALKRMSCSYDAHFLATKCVDFDGLKKIYSGREILELLQNADDAYSEYLKEGNRREPKIKALIKYDGKNLVVANKGKPFNIERIHILCEGDLSSKSGVIGCKGKGFRSLLNFSEEISIYSGNYSFRFSREFADRQAELIKENDRVQEAFSKRNSEGVNYRYPILFAPEEIPSINKDEWDTIIKLKLFSEQSVQDSIKKQLNSFDAIALLFLPNLSVIEIEMDDGKIVYEKIQRENHQYLIRKSKDENVTEEHSYYFFEAKSYVKNENYRWNIYKEKVENSKLLHLAVVIPEKNEWKDYKLYSYFPIRGEDSPFYAVLHATFELKEDRDNVVIPESEYALNKLVAEELLKFYLNTVKDNFCKKEFGNYAMELLTPKGFRVDVRGNCVCNKSFLSDFGLIGYYVKECTRNRNSGLLYSVQEKFLSYNDGPKYFEKVSSMPSSLKRSNEFSRFFNLNCSNTFHYNSVLNLAKSFLNLKDVFPPELKNTISETVKDFLSEDRVEILYWWCKSISSKFFPVLLKNDKGRFVTDHSKCFFTATLKGTPEWAEISVLSEEDEQNLLKEFSIQPSEKRTLKDLIGISDQSNLELIVESVNNSVTNHSRAVEFVRWLYNFYNKLTRDESKKKIQNNESLKIPTSDFYCLKKNTLLVKSYDNNLGEEIGINIGMAPVANYEDFNCEDFHWSKEEATQFFGEINIPKFPAIEVIVEDQSLLRDYLHNVIPVVPGNLNFREWSFDRSKVKSVKNISKLFEKVLDSSLILQWIVNDENLKRHLLQKTNESNIQFVLRQPGSAGRGATSLYPGLPSFLWWVFSTKAWLNISGCRKSPKDTTFEEVSQQDWYLKFDTNTRSEIKNALDNLGLRGDLLSLSPSQFYNYLNTTTDKDELLKLYRKIADPENNDKLNDKVQYHGPEKDKFLETGKVWASNKDGREEKLYPAKDAYFTSSAVLNIENRYLMKTPSRQGKLAIFQGIFGIQEYSEKVNVSSFELSKNNALFEDDLKNFVPYFLALRSGLTDQVIHDFKNLSVKMVSSISLTVNDRLFTMFTPYMVIKKSASEWFIYIGNEDYDKIQVTESLKTIFYVVLNNPTSELLNYCDLIFPRGEAYRMKLMDEKCISENEIVNIQRLLDSSIDYAKEFVAAFGGKVDNQSELELLVRDIDFNNLKQPVNMAKVIELAKKCSIDIPDVVNVLKVNIPIAAYYRKKLKMLYKLNENKILCGLVNSLKDKSIDEKKTLTSMREAIEKRIDDCEIIDSIHFDLESELRTVVGETFSSDSCENLGKVYGENKEKLFEICGVNISDFSFENDLLYFEINWADESDEIAAELKKLFNDKRVKESGAPSELAIERLRNVNLIGDAPITGSTYKYKGAGNRGSGPYTGKEQNGEPSKRQGDLAEYEVYNMILEKRFKEISDHVGEYKDENVKWLSGAAHRIKKYPANDSCGYDIEVSGSKGVLYIEVKSSVGQECSFFMSANEKLAAESDEKKDDYAVIFVGGVTTDCVNVRYLGNPINNAISPESTETNGYEFTPLKYHVDYRTNNS